MLLNSWCMQGAKPSLSFNFAAGSIVGSGGVTPSFTRATTKGILNWEGRYRVIRSGEVPFEGLRRVENFVTGKSEDFSNAAWTKSSINATPTTLTASGANGTCLQSLTRASADYVLRVRLSRLTGVGNIQLTIDGASFTTVTLTGGDQVFSIQQNGVTNPNFGIRIVTNGDAVNASQIQLEDCTGASNVNPSEYASVGLLASPYYGASVDGVRYVTTLNGNTVAANVVTEATGAPLLLAGGAVGQVGVIKGYFPEVATTNLCLQSENFGTTWVAVGTPTRVAASDRLGQIALDLIGDDDATALEGYTQAVTFTGDAVKAVSLFVKAGTSTSTVVRLRDTTGAADRLLVTLAWSGGAPTPTATTGTVLGTDALGNGVYRIRMATAAVTAANTNQIEVYPATTSGLAVANTGTVLAGGVQAENSTVATSYIGTTTATVTRNKDDLSVAALGTWFNANAGSIVVKIVNGYTGSNGKAFTLSDGTVNNRFTIFINANTPNYTVTTGAAAQVGLVPAALAAGQASVWAACYALNDFELYEDGTRTGTGDQVGTIPTVTGLNFADHALGSQFNGGIRSFDYYPQRVDNPTLARLST